MINRLHREAARKRRDCNVRKQKLKKQRSTEIATVVMMSRMILPEGFLDITVFTETLKLMTFVISSSLFFWKL